jgi:hypothetical protein
LGIGPPSVSVGDSVCILLGGQVPFIVRDETLIGECYVHGMMDGNMLEERWNEVKDVVLT